MDKTLQSIVDRFTAFKRPMIAESSLNKLVQCLDVLVERFGKDRDISSINLGDAAEFAHDRHIRQPDSPVFENLFRVAGRCEDVHHSG